MIWKKTISSVVCVLLAAVLALAGASGAALAKQENEGAAAAAYEEGLFDQSVVHTIDIEIADWDTFVKNATKEEYAACNVIIDGERIENVGLRAKGNTSLSSVAALGSQKYSLKIEFDHNVKGQTYQGLDKLSLNNLIYDATMMKDYLAYTLMRKMDVPASLCSFVELSVNGEPFSLYLAVEAVEDSFLTRNEMTVGELYKPDSMSMNQNDIDREEWGQRPEGTDENEGSSGASNGGAAQGQNEGNQNGSGGMQWPQRDNGQNPQNPQDMPAPGQAEGGSFGGNGGFPGGGGFGMGSSDVKLQYLGDDPESYPNIFDNAKTKVSKKDKARLIEALRVLSGDDAREAAFADEVIRFLAVHDFLQNSDSYTGNIIHNYYLYEENGQLAIIPWDYNLAFSGMGGGQGGTSTINAPIDSPVSGGVNDRPLVAWIFADDESLQEYHEVYGQFITEVVESGWLTEEIARVAALIRPYLETDENSFFSLAEFDAAVDTMQQYCTLRGQSIRGQLDGTIPSTSDGQRGSTALIDASSVSLDTMGGMNRGGNRWNNNGQQGSDGGSQGRRGN